MTMAQSALAIKTRLLRLTLRDYAAFSGLAIILIANAWFLSIIAFHGFNHFDFGSFLDASWRIYRGQKLYIDFYYHTGPLHLYLNVLFFLIFGFGKAAILAHMLTLNFIIVLVTFLVTWRRIPLFSSLLVTALSATGPYWSWPHPIYDISAQFWGILATALLVWQLPFKSPKRAALSGFLCGFLAVLSLMTKTNTGAAYGLAYFIVFLYSPLRWRALAGYVAGSLTALILVFTFFVPSLKSYYLNAYEYYGKWRANQFERFSFIPVWFKNLYWLPFFTVLYSSRPFRKRFPELFALFIAVGTVGLVALNTGSRRDWDHLPDMGMYLAIGFILMYQIKTLSQTGRQRIIAWIGIVLLIFTTVVQIKRSVGGGIRHYQNIHKGYPHGDYLLKAGPFHGWHLHPYIGEIMDAVVDEINLHVPKKDSLLIFCDLQILNALTGRDGYRGIPFIFHPGDYPRPEGELVDQVSANIQNNPPDWILITYNNGLAPMLNILELAPYFKLSPSFFSQYSEFKQWEIYILLKRNRST
jgi:hypothetical protein